MNTIANQEEVNNEHNAAEGKHPPIVHAHPIEHATKPEEHSGSAYEHHENSEAKSHRVRTFLAALTPGEKSAAVLGLTGAVIAAVFGILTVRIMNKQTDLTGEQNKLVKEQNTIMNRQNDLMDAQAKLMSKQIELERPWVSADFSITRIPFLEGTVVGLQYGVTLKNTGRSPALNVLVSSDLLAHEAGSKGFHVSQDPNRCGPLKGSLGISIFPGETHRIFPGTNLSVNVGSKKTRRGDMLLTVVTCIDYESPLSSEHHQTLYSNIVGGPSSAVLVTNDRPGEFRLLLRETPGLMPLSVSAN